MEAGLVLRPQLTRSDEYWYLPLVLQKERARKTRNNARNEEKGSSCPSDARTAAINLFAAAIVRVLGSH